MARDLNKVMLTGRLGRDVELRVTPSGTSVATFSVASSRNVREGDGRKEQTEWFRVVAWDRLAETCANYLKKGSRVYIEGRLQTRDWTDQQGQKRTTSEVIATDMMMLDSKPRQEEGVDSWDNAGSSSGSSRGRSEDYGDETDLEDIPF
ncbi:MAG TPA: single-stranded DNA-binding protein [Chloroflexia bacterium]|nr:single-stranded DNA-binding protein [Chloroflexia bacterium]